MMLLGTWPMRVPWLRKGRGTGGEMWCLGELFVFFCDFSRVFGCCYVVSRDFTC